MLNEWSDREPDPPGRPGCRVMLVAFVGLAIAAFIVGLVLSLVGD